MSSPRKAVGARIVALYAISIILAAALGAILISPQLIARSVTETSTSTATSTTTSTRTLLTTVSPSPSTTTSTAPETLTAFGTPSIGVITEANITIGKPSPYFRSMAIDTYTNTIYVSGPNVTEIDASNDKVVGAIPTPGRSSSIAVNPSTGLVYVNDENPCQNCTQGLFVINTGSRSVIGASMIRSINLEQYVSDIAVNSRTNMVYASSFGRTSLFIINGTTNAVVANVSLPGGFGTLAPVVSVNQFKNTVYVAACQGNSLGCSPTNVFAINGTSGSIIAQVPIEGGGEPLAMAVNPYIGEIYVTIQNELISINGSTYAETTDDVSALPLNCQGLATNFSNDILLSCSAMPDIPSFIVMNEGGSVINSFAQGGSPMGVAVGVDPEAVYLVNQNGYVLVVLYIPTSPLP